MNQIKKELDSTMPDHKVNFVPAKYPLLEERNPLTLALFIVGMGCDVFPGGIVTPLLIWKEVKKLDDDGVKQDDHGTQYKHFIDFYIKKGKAKDLKLTELDIRTFCQAFLYQPSIPFGQAENIEAYKYVFHKPTTLSPYLKMFLPPGSEIDKESERDILRCKGINEINDAHDFLRAEGSFTCSSCHACFCNTCGYAPVKDRPKRKKLVYYENMDKELCVNCYQQQIFLPVLASIDDA